MLGKIVLGSDCYWGPSVVLVEGDTNASHDCGLFSGSVGFLGVFVFSLVADASTGIKSRSSPGYADPVPCFWVSGVLGCLMR